MNLMLMNPCADEMAQIIVEEGVQVVTTGAEQSRQVHPRVERGRDQGAARGGGLHPCQAAGESGSRRHHRRGHGVRRPCG
ncbi:MAG: hypothetical protein ACLSHO_12660 [Dysosmobacter sp.]